MKILSRLSTALLVISFALPSWSALYMVSFVQPERAQVAAGKLHYMFTYENWVHEAGFARFTLSIIALLILFIPYRRRERWAFAALVIYVVTYYVPVFLFGAIPALGTWRIFRSLPQPRTVSIGWVAWYVFALTTCLVLGLALSTPLFFRRKGT